MLDNFKKKSKLNKKKQIYLSFIITNQKSKISIEGGGENGK